MRWPHTLQLLDFRMGVESVRKIFWLLIFLETILILLSDHVALKHLRATQFGERGNEEILNNLLQSVNLGIVIIYASAIATSIRIKRLLGSEPWPSRLKNLSIAVAWPVIVFLFYGYLVGYSAI